MRRVFFKGLCFVLSLMLCLSIITINTACGDRSEVLKIYNWGEYIADGTFDSIDVVREFEAWYEEMTGSTIRVEYSVFDTNETMYTQIYNKHADYDLVCPSDYTVSKLLSRGLLLPINDEEFEGIWADAFADESPEDYYLAENEEITYRNIFNPDLLDIVADFDSGWAEEDGTIYSMPYMWGSFGLLYDLEKIQELGGEDAAVDMESWEALFGDTYAEHIYMKNSVRDAYAAANIYNSIDKLSELSSGFTDYNDQFRAYLSGCMNDVDADKIAAAERTLKEQKSKLYAYENDEGKEDLLSGKSSAALGFVWSCDAGYVIGQELNYNLWYSVPKEGTNIWSDNFCIPRYAGNTQAAKYFLAFLNLYETAYENMWWVGSGSPITAVAEDIAWEICDPWGALEYTNNNLAEDEDAYEIDDFLCFADLYEEYEDVCTRLSDCECGWHAYAAMYAEAMCPTSDHTARGAVMTDFGDYSIDIVRMFVRVKSH